jgi:hypothetical protein
MHRAPKIVALVFALGLPFAASAGAVRTMFAGGAFGLPWNATAAAIEAKYPGGKWTADDKGLKLYCAPSKQAILKLPHQTRELCFLIGADGTMASATARMEPTLPALLAVVNRCRTMFGDFNAVRRDEEAIQSRFTFMLWSSDAPYLVQVGSSNDQDGSPVDVTFTIADEAALHMAGADAVTNKPNSQGK